MGAVLAEVQTPYTAHNIPMGM